MRIGDIIRAMPQQIDQLSNSLTNIVNSNSNNNNNAVDINDVEDESRFEVPTDETKMQQQKRPDDLAGGGDPQSQDGIVTINNNSLNNISENDFETRLKSLLNCNVRDYKPDIGQRGDFWVLKNYIKAEHGELKCHETITYTTHADYSFLDNLPPLMER